MGPTEKIKLMRANAKEEHMREFLILHRTNQQAGLAIGIGHMAQHYPLYEARDITRSSVIPIAK